MAKFFDKESLLDCMDTLNTKLTTCIQNFCLQIWFTTFVFNFCSQFFFKTLF